jgi:hypothetical protein
MTARSGKAKYFQISVENRDYHRLSQSEIGGDNFSTHSRPERTAVAWFANRQASQATS